MTKPLQRQQIEAELAERAWQDEAFRSELLANPKATVHQTLQAYDMGIKNGVTVQVHEETPYALHLVIPLPPDYEEDAELDDELLDLVAGGSGEGGTIHTCEEPNCAPASCTRYS